MSDKTKLSNPEFSSFYKKNPDIDILHFDFYNKDAVGKLNLSKASQSKVLEGLMIDQRLLRIEHMCRSEDDAESMAGIADVLKAAGFNSAIRIATIPEHKFIREYSKIFANDEEKTKKVHRAAQGIAAKTRHLFANVHNAVASPHFRSMLTNNTDNNTAEYFENIPSYQDLFGSLDYTAGDQCTSIFSPAAYFLDMMRITDEYITDPNTHKTSGNIPAGYKLSERRPDLFEINLNCKNTTDLVPYLQIVNSILDRSIANDLKVTSGTAQSGDKSSITLASIASGDDNAYKNMLVIITGGTGISQVRTITSYSGTNKIATVDSQWDVIPQNNSQYTISGNTSQMLAIAKYPFNLPFNLPLEQIRKYSDNLGVTLPEVFKSFNSPVTAGNAQSATNTKIVLAAGSSVEDNAYNTMQIAIIKGKGVGQVRTITAYKGDTKEATIDTNWNLVPDETTQYHIFDFLDNNREYLGLSIEEYNSYITSHDTSEIVAPFYGLLSIDLIAIAKVATFLKITGLEWKQLDELLVQGLSQEELSAGVANNFYINNTNEKSGCMQIIIDKTDPDAPFYKIANISIKRLDRLNRFIRLAVALNWSFPALECALASLSDPSQSNYDITEGTIKSLAGIKYLQNKSGLPVEELCSLWHDMQTTGKSNTINPQDLFDTTFNNPALLKGQDPYKSTVPIPFDPSRPLTWTIDDVNDTNGIIRSRLSGALQLNDNDLILLGKYVQGLTGQEPGKLILNLTNLSWLFRLSKAASTFELTIDEYLVFLNLMYYPGSLHKQPPAGQLKLSVSEIIAQSERADWYSKSPFNIYEVLYILKGIQSPLFKAPYKTGDIAPLIQNMSTIAEGTRVKGNGFLFGDIDAQQSQQIFSRLIEEKFLSFIGIILNNKAKYQEAADNFPFDSNSFITKDILKEASEKVYIDLQKCHPPVLLSQDTGTSAILSHSYYNNTNLDFLFVNDNDADNKRNQVRAILSKTQGKVDITEYAFLFPFMPSGFMNKMITKQESERVFYDLRVHYPEDSSDPIIIPVDEFRGLLNADYDKNTGLDFLFTSTGKGQSKKVTVYTGDTHTITVDSDWKTIPDRTSVYQVIDIANQGNVTEGTKTTITLSSDASKTDGEYNGMAIRITGGKGKSQERVITAYIGGETREATVNNPWDTIPDNTSVYNIFVVVNQGTAEGGNSNQIKLDSFASSVDGSYNDKTVVIIDDPDAELKRSLIEGQLLTKKQDIAHVANVMHISATSQESNVLNGLADFLQTTPELLASILPFAVGGADISDYAEAFLTPITDGQVPQKVPPFISAISRSLILFNNLSFNTKEIQAVLDMPRVFNIEDPYKISFDNIRILADFKTLKKDFNDKDNTLISYFNLPPDKDIKSPKITTLSKLTLWEPAWIQTLINLFWPENTVPSDYDYNTVEGIVRLKAGFDISDKTKIGIDGLIRLKNIGYLPIADQSGKVIQNNWLEYNNQSTIIQGAVNAKLAGEEFDRINAQNAGYLNSQKRDALLGFSIWLLNKKFSHIQQPSDLYQYLLIDVEMSGCDNISYIAQGIASIQLYMQRCRMMLEPGVTDLSNIPNIWWEWTSAYRIWEANRKIFLYPENYLDPVLRRSQTPQFKKFAGSLLQTNIDNGSVATAYKNYFSDFAEVAGLVNCASYMCKTPVSGSSKQLDTLFVFGRTNKQPYTFYYRKFDNQYAWSAWQKLEISVNSLFISPVFAFNKLFIFWTEIDAVDSSKVKASDSVPITTNTSKIKFSYLNNYDGKWIEPQTLASDIVINYEENYELDECVRTALPAIVKYFNPTEPYWQQIYTLHVPESSISHPEKYPNGENIFINYGFGLVVKKGSVLPIITPSDKTAKNQYSFEMNTCNAIGRFNKLGIGSPDGVSSYVNLLQSVNMDINLKNSLLNTVFVCNVPFGNPQPYVPVLFRPSNILGISPSPTYNIIIDNYYSDNYCQFPKTPSAPPQLTLLGNISSPASSIITVKNLTGSFIFDNGDEAFLVVTQEKGIKCISDLLISASSYPPFPADEFYFSTNSYTIKPTPFANLKFKFSRLSTNVVNSLNQKLIIGGIDNLLTINSQQTPELSFSRLSPDLAHAIAPDTDKLDFNGAYGLYFWETFFHGPFLVAHTLNVNKRYDDAKKWYQYIFNPTQQPEAGAPADTERFWQFLPFRSMDNQTLTQILTNPAQIFAYNNDPFDPDAIARLRISAYAKTIVMKYIDNLIDWGDYLFEQDTRESITQASNLYVLASDILGKRPVQTGEFKPPKAKNYNDIKEEYNDKTILTGTAVSGSANSITLAANASSENDAYDGMYISITDGTGKGQQNYIKAYNGKTKNAVITVAWDIIPDNTSIYRVFLNGIPDFLVRLENTGPMLVTKVEQVQEYSGIAFNDINSYFSIPENQEFITYWDRVEDRLFKIRHCMNIKGMVRTLALFEPPIDPKELIRAAAGSGSLSTSLQMNVNVPRYRFSVMIEKAKSLTSSLMQLGSSLLSAMEKKDSEALSLLRNSQENALLNLTTFIKEQQVEELVKLKDSLNESLKSANKRNSYYSNLIAKGLSPAEITNIVGMTSAMVFNVAAGVTKTLASIGYAVPQAGSPFAMTYGGEQIGAALNAASGALEIGSVVSNFVAQLSLTIAGYQRRADEWQLQADLSGFDIEQINDQVQANEIRQAISKRELENHKISINQNKEMEEFLKNKFTNQELYQWMVTRVSSVYFQTYSLAYELALAAQKAYQFELDVNQSFVNFGYWDNLHKGLLAGEGLMLALNQMEKSYLDNNARALEIEKTVSLMQLNPKALIDLITKGECTFELSERLFDDDYPGHYDRKIKTISISIPAVIGPYQNIKATLSQLSNQIIIKPNVNAVDFLLGGKKAKMPEADEMRSNWLVNQQIAISKGVNDSGMFELNFRDERYLPFEGTGAVSSWILSMPKATNRINFENIPDVIIQLKYTATDGGSKFREDVTKLDAMKNYYGSRSFTLSNMFPQQWYDFLNDHSCAVKQEMKFTLRNLCPVHIEKQLLTGFYFKLDVPEGVNSAGTKKFVQLNLPGSQPIDFNLDNKGSFLYTFNRKPSLESIEGNGSVDFLLESAPVSLLAKNGFLNPEVVKDIKLVFFYEGEILWRLSD